MTATTTPARELIITALTRASAPLTVTELAEQAGVGKSTVSKYLPALERNGAAVRTPGGRDGRRRLPDHWQAPPTTPTEQPTDATLPTAEDRDGADTAGLADEVPAREGTDPDLTSGGTGHTAPTPVEAGEAATADYPAPRAEQPDTGPAHVPAGEMRPAPAAPVPAPDPVPVVPSPCGPGAPTQHAVRTGTGGEGVNPVSGSARLAPGELKVMVWALLDGEPGREFSATELSHLLAGRSIGAIQNNLARLLREGKAELTCDKPRRYRCAPHTP